TSAPSTSRAPPTSPRTTPRPWRRPRPKHPRTPPSPARTRSPHSSPGRAPPTSPPQPRATTETPARPRLTTSRARVIAWASGLGSTYMTATKGTDLGTLKIGAWTARPKTGTSDVDPYSRAIIVRSGELPVGTGDGVAFTATTDDKDRPLDGRCDVVVS